MKSVLLNIPKNNIVLQNGKTNKIKNCFFFTTVTTKKKFGEIHKPRSTSEKKKHLDIINEIYFDMTEAMKEKNLIELREYKNMDHNLSEILFNYNASKKNEAFRNIMRYCIEWNNQNNQKKDKIMDLNQNNEISNYNHNHTKTDYNINYNKNNTNISITSNNNTEPILEIISSTIKEYSSQFNTCEIGIILKCLIKIKNNDIYLINILLNYYFKRNMTFSEYGTLYVFNSFTKFNLLPYHEKKFKLLCSDILHKLHYFNLKNICLICNYASSLYNYNMKYITNFIQEVCRFIIEQKDITTNVVSKSEKHATSLNITPIITNNTTVKPNANITNIKLCSEQWTPESIHYITNACARVNYLNKELFLYLKNIIEKRVTYFTLDQLVSLINAYSKFKNAEESNFLSLFVLLPNEIIKKSYMLKPRHLSVLANAYNNACVLHEYLFHVITENSISHISLFEPKQIVMLIHSYVNIGLSQNTLLNHLWDISLTYMHFYSIQELSMLLQAYTKGLQHIENFFDTLTEKIYYFFTTAYNFLNKNNDNETYVYETYTNVIHQIEQKSDFFLENKTTPELLLHKNISEYKPNKNKSNSMPSENTFDYALLFYLIMHQYNHINYSNNMLMNQQKYLHYNINLNKNMENKTCNNELFFYEILYNKKHNNNMLAKENGLAFDATDYSTNDVTNNDHNKHMQFELCSISNYQTSMYTNSSTTNNDNTLTNAQKKVTCIDVDNTVVDAMDSKVFHDAGTDETTTTSLFRAYTNTMHNQLIKHLSKNVNPTLICSIIYSLIKGNRLLQYELLICLTKISIIFLNKFKYSELGNVCSALSEAFIQASDENNKQNNIISQNMDYIKKKKTNSLTNNNKTTTTTTTTITSNNNHQQTLYNEKLYILSKQYLYICVIFFDHVEFYLKQKKNIFTDINSVYKYIISFGKLRMNKYSTVALHLFKLYITKIKILTYLPLQKLIDAFIQLNVYDEDVYAFLKKLQKIKKSEKK
ncbi:conserved protein, unknown function [Hepatocystis sp. ex Piliocolobus tephrosceles]|nr:conserved protein, unknown function [Hepatocystis sp. ex Piliocolobus tephrosceles]